MHNVEKGPKEMNWEKSGTYNGEHTHFLSGASLEKGEEEERDIIIDFWSRKFLQGLFKISVMRFLKKKDLKNRVT